MFVHQPFEHLPALIEHNSDAGRWYLDGSRQFPSVTYFIQQRWDRTELDAWRKNVGDDEADWLTEVGRKRGQVLHTGIEQYLTNQGCPQFEKDPLNRLLFFRMKHELDKIDNIRCIEDPLCSYEWEIAGRPDCVATYNGVYSVIDFKTSTKVKSKKFIIGYFLQCGFYGKMVRELYGEEVERAVIIMGTEKHPLAQTFQENMTNCIAMAEQFMNDPVKFQKRVKAFQLNKKEAQI